MNIKSEAQGLLFGILMSLYAVGVLARAMYTPKTEQGILERRILLCILIGSMYTLFIYAVFDFSLITAWLFLLGVAYVVYGSVGGDWGYQPLLKKVVKLLMWLGGWMMIGSQVPTTLSWVTVKLDEIGAVKWLQGMIDLVQKGDTGFTEKMTSIGVFVVVCVMLFSIVCLFMTLGIETKEEENTISAQTERK